MMSVIMSNSSSNINGATNRYLLLVSNVLLLKRRRRIRSISIVLPNQVVGQIMLNVSTFTSSSWTELFLNASCRSKNDKESSTTTTTTATRLLKCFPLESHHIGHSTHIITNTTTNEVKKQLLLSYPTEFHRDLCHRILHAKQRILLATLYIGTASDEKPMEKQFLNALQKAANNLKQQKQTTTKIKVLMDASRARRKVSTSESSNNKTSTATTCSAQKVFNCINANSTLSIQQQQQEGQYGVYLFHVHPLTQLLSSPINEAIGVFHMKAYVIDDTLILSGANLSEEYFVNRHDRYLVFTNGANGLVDFYANLIEVLCSFSEKYTTTNKNDQPLVGGASSVTSTTTSRYFIPPTKQRDLYQQLLRLFYSQEENTYNNDTHNNHNNNIIAYAIPTIHFPISYIKELNFASDIPIIQNLISCAKDQQQQRCKGVNTTVTTNNATETNSSKPLHTSIRLASAYLNPTSNFMKTVMMLKSSKKTATSFTSLLNNPLQNFYDVEDLSSREKRIATAFLLTAGRDSHGFAPKKTQCNTRSKNTSWVPDAYHHIYSRIQSRYNNRGSLILLLFNREDWTFHSKGLWMTVGYEEEEAGAEANQVDMQTKQQLYLSQSQIRHPHNLRVVVIGSGKDEPNNC